MSSLTDGIEVEASEQKVVESESPIVVEKNEERDDEEEEAGKEVVAEEKSEADNEEEGFAPEDAIEEEESADEGTAANKKRKRNVEVTPVRRSLRARVSINPLVAAEAKSYESDTEDEEDDGSNAEGTQMGSFLPFSEFVNKLKINDDILISLHRAMYKSAGQKTQRKKNIKAWQGAGSTGVSEAENNRMCTWINKLNAAQLNALAMSCNIAYVENKSETVQSIVNLLVAPSFSEDTSVISIHKDDDEVKNNVEDNSNAYEGVVEEGDEVVADNCNMDEACADKPLLMENVESKSMETKNDNVDIKADNLGISPCKDKHGLVDMKGSAPTTPCSEDADTTCSAPPEPAQEEIYPQM